MTSLKAELETGLKALDYKRQINHPKLSEALHLCDSVAGSIKNLGPVVQS